LLVDSADDGAFMTAAETARFEVMLEDIQRGVRVIAESQVALTARIDRIEAQFSARFDALEIRFTALEARFGALEQRFAGMETRVTAVESRLEDFAADTQARLHRIEDLCTSTVARSHTRRSAARADHRHASPRR
jgi:hypothetical protein